MDDVGIKICEGYGLTETSPIITLNTPLNRNPGFVGKPLPGVKGRHAENDHYLRSVAKPKFYFAEGDLPHKIQCLSPIFLPFP